MQGQARGRHSRFQISHGNQPPELPKILVAMETHRTIRQRGRFSRTHDARAVIINTVRSYERGAADDLVRTLLDAGVLIEHSDGSSRELWFDPKRAQHVITCYDNKRSLGPVDPGRLEELKAAFSGTLAPKETQEDEPVAIVPQYVIYLTPAQHRLWQQIDTHLDAEDTDGYVPKRIARGRPFSELVRKRLLIVAPDAPDRYMPAFDHYHFRVLPIRRQPRLQVSAPVLTVIQNVQHQQWVPPHDGQGCEASFIRWVEREQVHNVPRGIELNARDLRDKFFTSVEEGGWGIVVHQPDLTRPLICWKGAEPFRFVPDDESLEEDVDDPDTESTDDPDTTESGDSGPSQDESSADTSSDQALEASPADAASEGGASAPDVVTQEPGFDVPAPFAGPLAHLQIYEADGIQTLTEAELGSVEASWQTILEIANGQLALVAQERERREEVRRAEAERQRKIAAARRKKEEIAARRAALEAQLAALAEAEEAAELEMLELST